MPENIQATVRRRTAADDKGVSAEDIWPERFRWVAEWDHYEDGRWISGCSVPFETHPEALREALSEADSVRRRNAAGLVTVPANGGQS